MQGRTETHIFTSPPGAAPGAAHVWATPEVRVTWGCITKSVSPTRGITVKPQVGPTPPRVRATVCVTLLTLLHARDCTAAATWLCCRAA